MATPLLIPTSMLGAGGLFTPFLWMGTSTGRQRHWLRAAQEKWGPGFNLCPGAQALSTQMEKLRPKKETVMTLKPCLFRTVPSCRGLLRTWCLPWALPDWLWLRSASLGHNHMGERCWGLSFPPDRLTS